MKILHVIQYFSRKYGGEVEACLNIAKAQVSLGHKVDILTTDFDLDRSLAEGTGVNLHVVHTVLHVGLARYAPGTKRWTREHIAEYDTVHLHSYMAYMAVVVSKAAGRNGVPLVLQVHNSLRPYGGKSWMQNTFDSLWGRKIIRRASSLIAYGEREKADYIELGGDPEKMHILPNGVDCSVFDDLPVRGAMRTKYGVTEDEVLFIYIGRLDKIKRIDLGMKALALLEKEGARVRMAVIGPDIGDEARLRQTCKELGLDGRVFFTGPLYGKDKVQALVDSDVLINTSVSEGFSIVGLEAAACGRPVIMTRESGVADLISQGMGLLVGDDVNEVAAAMRAMLSPEAREKYGLSGKKLVKGSVDWPIVAQKSLDIYSSAKR